MFKVTTEINPRKTPKNLAGPTIPHLNSWISMDLLLISLEICFFQSKTLHHPSESHPVHQSRSKNNPRHRIYWAVIDKEGPWVPMVSHSWDWLAIGDFWWLGWLGVFCWILLKVFKGVEETKCAISSQWFSGKEHVSYQNQRWKGYTREI